MVLTISKQEIFNEVEKRSSLEGYVIPERYDNVWANESRGALLDSFWVEGCTAVVQLLKRYLTGQTITHDLTTYNKDEVFTINATMPERYSSLLDGNITTDVKMLIACNILHEWLEVTSPDAAAKYDEEAKGYSEDLRVKLLYRIEPTNKVIASKSDGEKITAEEHALASKSDVVVLEQRWGKCCLDNEIRKSFSVDN